MRLKENIADEEVEEAPGNSAGNPDAPPPAKRIKLAARSKGSDSGKTGRTSKEDSFWNHISEYLKAEHEYYKSNNYTSAQWKE